jgi:hypothetical protein
MLLNDLMRGARPAGTLERRFGGIWENTTGLIACLDALVQINSALVALSGPGFAVAVAG